MDAPKIATTYNTRDFRLALPNLMQVRTMVCRLAEILGGTQAEARQLIKLLENRALTQEVTYRRLQFYGRLGALRDLPRHMSWDYNYPKERNCAPGWTKSLDFRCWRLPSGRIEVTFARGLSDDQGRELAKILGVDDGQPADQATIELVFPSDEDGEVTIPLVPLYEVIEDFLREPYVILSREQADRIPSWSDYGYFAESDPDSLSARFACYSAYGWAELLRDLWENDGFSVYLAEDRECYPTPQHPMSRLEVSVVRRHLAPCTATPSSFEMASANSGVTPASLGISTDDMYCRLANDNPTHCGCAVTLQLESSGHLEQQRQNDPEFRGLVQQLATNLGRGYQKHLAELRKDGYFDN